MQHPNKTKKITPPCPIFFFLIASSPPLPPPHSPLRKTNNPRSSRLTPLSKHPASCSPPHTPRTLRTALCPHTITIPTPLPPFKLNRHKIPYAFPYHTPPHLSFPHPLLPTPPPALLAPRPVSFPSYAISSNTPSPPHLLRFSVRVCCGPFPAPAPAALKPPPPRSPPAASARPPPPSPPTHSWISPPTSLSRAPSLPPPRHPSGHPYSPPPHFRPVFPLFPPSPPDSHRQNFNSFFEFACFVPP